MTLTPDSIVAATTNMVAADIGDEVIMLHLEKGKYFGLGAVGTRIWELLRAPIAVAEIERTLIEEYEVGAEQCHEEVTQFISELLDEGLVEVRGK